MMEGEFLLLIEHDRRTNEVLIGISDTAREYEDWEEIPKETLKALKETTEVLNIYFTQLLLKDDDDDD